MSKLSDTLRDRLALTAMLDSGGWPVICAQAERRFTELTDSILDPKTSAAEAEVLRQARAKIKEVFAPQVLLNDLLTRLDAVVKRESPPTPTPPPSP